jgi:glycosyltransferase involved in cell wall biosynthesis
MADPLSFTIALPTFNRAGLLARAVASVRAQTYPHWRLRVLDDASTDATAAVMAPFVAADPRISYERFPENRGAVAMDEVGMMDACSEADVWTRVASDDWWNPQKLEHDAAALGTAEATYGPYSVFEPDTGRLYDVAEPHVDPREAMLVAFKFVVSWANVAVRTRLLQRLYARHGNFCPSVLRHVNDIVVNARLLRLAEFTFRPGVDAVWSTGGASFTESEVVMREGHRSWHIVGLENAADAT